MEDGVVKVAIVRNLAVGDHTRQFLESCVSEGRAMGFTVDTFITGGDDERCRELIARIAEADYDGLILSNGGAFTYDALKPLADRGIKAVTFDALPYKNGVIAPGVTSTAQDDAKLAEISLEAILSRFGKERPPRIIRVWFGPGIPPLDRRLEVYSRFLREGKIEELALVGPPDFAFSRTGTREALAAVLPLFPPGSVDALWAPYDEFAKGCADALEAASRKDIKLISIDISNDDIRLMQDHGDLWLCTAAVDPGLIGAVNMRILAAKFAGETAPESYSFEGRLVETAGLNRGVNMANMALTVPGWKDAKDPFGSYPWMEELKRAGGKYPGGGSGFSGGLNRSSR
jgi:simple sugar transport system substrate-binding protein